MKAANTSIDDATPVVKDKKTMKVMKAAKLSNAAKESHMRRSYEGGTRWGKTTYLC